MWRQQSDELDELSAESADLRARSELAPVFRVEAPVRCRNVFEIDRKQNWMEIEPLITVPFSPQVKAKIGIDLMDVQSTAPIVLMVLVRDEVFSFAFGCDPAFELAGATVLIAIPVLASVVVPDGEGHALSRRYFHYRRNIVDADRGCKKNQLLSN